MKEDESIPLKLKNIEWTPLRLKSSEYEMEIDIAEGKILLTFMPEKIDLEVVLTPESARLLAGGLARAADAVEE